MPTGFSIASSGFSMAASSMQTCDHRPAGVWGPVTDALAGEFPIAAATVPPTRSFTLLSVGGARSFIADGGDRCRSHVLCADHRTVAGFDHRRSFAGLARVVLGAGGSAFHSRPDPGHPVCGAFGNRS